MRRAFKTIQKGETLCLLKKLKKKSIKKIFFVGPTQIAIVIVDNNLRKAYKRLFGSYTHSQLILKASLNESIHLLKKKKVS